VAAKASLLGSDQPISIQWQVNRGSGFVSIPDGAGPSLSFGPTLANAGERYRALLFSPGASATSSVATLTVQQGGVPLGIDCPPDQVVAFSSPTGAVVGFTITARPCDANLELDCEPPSGSTFPIGLNQVRCTVTDTANGTSENCTFVVEVLGGFGVTQNVLSELTALRASATRKQDRDKLDDAIDHLTRALDPSLWVDQTHPSRQHGVKVFDEGKDAVKKLCELIQDAQSTISAAILQGFIDRIFVADRLLAAIAIQDGIQAGASQKKIAEANLELAKGDQAVGDEKCDNGIEHYSNGWKAAVDAKISGIARLPNGHVQLQILCNAADTCTIQVSSNYTAWQDIAVRTATDDGVIEFEDANAGDVAARFYRVLSP
jgi:hypothetical protein